MNGDVPQQTAKEITKLATQNEVAIQQVQDMFLSPWNLLVVLALICIGISLKTSKRFPDWGILFAMIPLGIIFAELILTMSFRLQLWASSLMIGIVDGVFAFYSHQIMKQTLESPLGKSLSVWSPALVSILAAISGADMNKATTQIISKAVAEADLTKDDTAKIVEVIKGTGDGSIQIESAPLQTTAPTPRPSAVFVIPAKATSDAGSSPTPPVS